VVERAMLHALREALDEEAAAHALAGSPVASVLAVRADAFPRGAAASSARRASGRLRACALRCEVFRHRTSSSRSSPRHLREPDEPVPPRP
jgi:hypothetical protein